MLPSTVILDRVLLIKKSDDKLTAEKFDAYYMQRALVSFSTVPKYILFLAPFFCIDQYLKEKDLRIKCSLNVMKICMLCKMRKTFHSVVSVSFKNARWDWRHAVEWIGYRIKTAYLTSIPVLLVINRKCQSILHLKS